MISVEHGMHLLRESIKNRGQATVARELGYSPSAINQVFRGNYKGSLTNLMERIAETYGNGTVTCPVMGEIALRRCAQERKKIFGVSSPQRVKLWRACRECEARKQ
jgi:hypothetical protein